MTFRLDRLVIGDDREIVSVSGRVAAENLDLLRNVLKESHVVAIDLKDVFLIDRDGVKLLVDAEANGVELRNCPAYIREWVARERAQINRDRSEQGPPTTDGADNV